MNIGQVSLGQNPYISPQAQSLGIGVSGSYGSCCVCPGLGAQSGVGVAASIPNGGNPIMALEQLMIRIIDLCFQVIESLTLQRSALPQAYAPGKNSANDESGFLGDIISAGKDAVDTIGGWFETGGTLGKIGELATKVGSKVGSALTKLL